MNYIDLKKISDINVQEVREGGKKQYQIRINMNNGNGYYIEQFFSEELETHNYLLEEGFLKNLKVL